MKLGRPKIHPRCPYCRHRRGRSKQRCITAIRRMVKMRKTGKSLRAIAAALGTEGFKLSHFGVQKIIDGARDEGD
jgi:hypothetical protein